MRLERRSRQHSIISAYHAPLFPVPSIASHAPQRAAHTRNNREPCCVRTSSISHGSVSSASSAVRCSRGTYIDRQTDERQVLLLFQPVIIIAALSAENSHFCGAALLRGALLQTRLVCRKNITIGVEYLELPPVSWRRLGRARLSDALIQRDAMSREVVVCLRS